MAKREPQMAKSSPAQTVCYVEHMFDPHRDMQQDGSCMFPMATQFRRAASTQFCLGPWDGGGEALPILHHCPNQNWVSLVLLF